MSLFGTFVSLDFVFSGKERVGDLLYNSRQYRGRRVPFTNPAYCLLMQDRLHLSISFSLLAHCQLGLQALRNDFRRLDTLSSLESGEQLDLGILRNHRWLPLPFSP